MHAPEPEIEETYEVAAGGVSAVLGCLDSLSLAGLEVDGRAFRCDTIASRVSAYFYLRTALSEQTDRLIFEYKRRKVVGRLSSKRWVTSSSEAVKYHCGEVKKRDLSDWATLLRQRPLVEAALLKAKRRYTFRAGSGEGFKLALDAMVPFRPDAPLVSGDPFFHLEVEAIERCEPASVIRALSTLHHEFGRMPAIDYSKKERAAEVAAGAARLCFSSGRELRRHLDEVYGTAGARLRAVLPELFAAGPNSPAGGKAKTPRQSA